jgi:restriction system protein
MARKKHNDILPTFDELIIPTIKGLIKLGGSGTIDEINETVYQIAKLSEETLQIAHGENGLRSEVDYRLAWSRTYLKKYGLIENSSRGIWALSNADIDVSKLNVLEIVRVVREQSRPNKQKCEQSEDEAIIDQIEETTDWKEKLLNVLFEIKPDAFERLAQRLLRESGFAQVEVTGRSGDGGIDGKGIVKISGFLSFYVIFQCKKHKDAIGSRDIRDFRGAMQGRTDKGIFITTSTFTRDAIKEATRDGVPPIDLIDGDLLCEKLREYKLGIETKLIEKYEVNQEWFAKL